MRLFNLLSSVITGIGMLSHQIAAHSVSRSPLNYLSLIESPSIETVNHRVHAYSHFDLSFDLHRNQQHILLRLEPNYDILHEDAHIEVIDAQGRLVAVEKIVREDHRVYQGKTFEVEEDGHTTYVGRARIVVRRDGIKPLFEGSFQIGDDGHHIQLKSSYMATKHVEDPHLEEDDDEYMVVWRDSDVGSSAYQKRSTGMACGSDRLAFNTNPNHPVFKPKLRRDEGYWGSMSFGQILGKRQNIDGGGQGNGNSAGVSLSSSIGNSAGCPNTRKVALVGIATDCGYAASFNSTESMKQNIVTVMNTASDLYQTTFNITLALANLTISDETCPTTTSTSTPWNVACSSNSTDMNDRLNTFSSWRGQRTDTNAYWSLFTSCNTGAEVGLAWLGQLCNHGSTAQGSTQSVTGANVIARTSTEWQVFAHETGHTFGAVHDCDSTTCAQANIVSSNQCCPLSSSTCNANAQYIMNPYTSAGITKFSACTVGNICSALGRNSVSSTCLSDNKGVVTYTGAICGNGIVEDGEECDCGGTAGCVGNKCCNPTTCKFTTNSVCDPSNDGCCSAQCQFSSNGTVCRASTGVCDPAETCSGTSAACPADQTSPDGTGCGGGLQCASGQCTSRDLQCVESLGSYASSNDTYACNADTCTITCGSPTFGANVCYSLNQNFLDGTPCEGDGACKNGVCVGASTGGQIRSWIDSNKTLFIALVAGVGGVILLSILGCIVRACRRRRLRKQGVAVMAGRPHGRRHRSQHPNQAWDGPPIPAQMQQPKYGDNGFGDQWQAQSQYQDHNPPHFQDNGIAPSGPPPWLNQPPPSYHPAPYSPGHGGYPGGNSVRYA